MLMVSILAIKLNFIALSLPFWAWKGWIFANGKRTDFSELLKIVSCTKRETHVPKKINSKIRCFIWLRYPPLRNLAQHSACQYIQPDKRINFNPISSHFHIPRYIIEFPQLIKLLFLQYTCYSHTNPLNSDIMQLNNIPQKFRVWFPTRKLLVTQALRKRLFEVNPPILELLYTLSSNYWNQRCWVDDQRRGLSEWAPH